MLESTSHINMAVYLFRLDQGRIRNLI